MARDHLGLFDTPPDRHEVRFGAVIAGLFFITLLIVIPARDVRLGPGVAFVPTVNAVMFTGELIIAILLYAQAAVFRSRALTALASGYVFGALLLVPHTLTFPGVFTPSGALGAGINTTAWLATFRRLAFPAAVIVYVFLKHADLKAPTELDRRTPSALLWLMGAITLAAFATLLATAGEDLLPPFFLDVSQAIRPSLVISTLVAMAITLAAIGMLLRQSISVLDVWLLVALSGWLAQSILNLTLSARFTLGFYWLFGLMMVSSLVVMLALVAESNRLFARLALSTAVISREREARSMSMGAVAAAIAHEVGQPLAAARLNATAGIEWLSRDPGDAGKAISSLHATIDAVGRTFDVIKSIRASFANGSGSLSEFSLSELARETASLLEMDMAAQKISLQLNLDDGLPTVRANRVQIQRVLINLLTNAIDSVGATRRRNRLIGIHTMPAGGQGALLEITDSGLGIAQDEAAHIFEPFYTTKSTGMGLGLSLSRTIVEQHGGRLWLSQQAGQGARFHLQLPLRALRES